MSTTVEQLLASALELPEPDRLQLAEALFASTEPPPFGPTGEAWLEELQRRSAEVDAGTAKLMTWDEVRNYRPKLETGRSDG